jgi:hypothetical protein
VVGNPEAIGTLTFHAGYATSRISSILNGSTKQFGWLQAPATKSSFLSRTSTNPATIRICGLQLGIRDLPIETICLGLNAGAEVSPCCSSSEHKLI